MCGIGGIINLEYTTFDKKSFETIGVLNDERGGDSCGIFIDGVKSLGLKPFSYFRQFTIKTEYPLFANISLLHCRKTSSGNLTNEFQCQPVTIEEDGQIKYVLMHNGTIYNEKSLAKKYIPNINISNMSDSQIMAHIFYYSGYEALKEYTGTAAFSIIDYREEVPKVLFFSGDSYYNSKTEDYDVERQLYYIKDDTRFMFSSVYSALYLIDPSLEINKFSTNQLLQLINNELVSIGEYKRPETYVNTYQSSIQTHFSFGGNSAYNNYDDYDEYYIEKYANNSSHSSYIRYEKKDHLYYIGSKPAHGTFMVYASGYITTASFGKYNKEFNFYHGKLVISKAHLNLLNFYEKQLEGYEYVKLLLVELIDYCAYEPVLDTACPLIIDDQLEYHSVSEVFYKSFFPCRNNTVSDTTITQQQFTDFYDSFIKECVQKKTSIIDLSLFANNLLKEYGSIPN